MSACAHKWKPYVKNEVAFFSKRSDGKTPDAFRAIGDIKHCVECPTLFFFPHEKELSPVEVEIVWPDEDSERVA